MLVGGHDDGCCCKLRIWGLVSRWEGQGLEDLRGGLWWLRCFVLLVYYVQWARAVLVI